MIRWLRQNMSEERSSEPVDLKKELQLAQGEEKKLVEMDAIEFFF